jgi:cyclopropane-fatty-acyl-phospholipid synthase
MSLLVARSIERARLRCAAIPDRLARALVHRRLEGIRDGRIVVEDSGGTREFGAHSDLPSASIEVRDPCFYRRVATGGSLGFAESYLRGEWRTPDLTALLRVFARAVARNGGGRWTHAALQRPFARLAHALRRNSRRGSRRNIRDHYDLGNDFYALFLDETMTYSCAIFAAPDEPLRDASHRKLDAACRKLGLRPGHRVLEIGSGWGSFALHAARAYGCHVTTTTISGAQHDHVRARVEAEGLADLIDVLSADYRDLRGEFDRLVSIEMIEAVGHGHLPDYFRACAGRLQPDGAMLLQAITIPDRDYAAYLASVDYIQGYVFPGSSLPSLGAIVRAVGDHTDLRVHAVESIGRHYAETLRRWRSAFAARLDDVRGLGFDDRFVRLWTYYLCYCEAGFEEGYVDDLQIVLGRPGWRADAAVAVTGQGASGAARGEGAR